MNFWLKSVPGPPENPSDHFEPVSASPDHSQPIFNRFYIFDFLLQRCFFFQVFLKYFLYFPHYLSSRGSGTTPKLKISFSRSNPCHRELLKPPRQLIRDKTMSKKCPKTFLEVFLKFFFLLFLEPWRLWDHSQIVDLIFLIRMVSTRAHETPKTTHS